MLGFEVHVHGENTSTLSYWSGKKNDNASELNERFVIMVG